MWNILFKSQGSTVFSYLNCVCFRSVKLMILQKLWEQRRSLQKCPWGHPIIIWWIFLLNVVSDKFKNFHMTIFCSCMKWCPSSIVSWIFVWHLIYDHFANFLIYWWKIGGGRPRTPFNDANFDCVAVKLHLFPITRRLSWWPDLTMTRSAASECGKCSFWTGSICSSNTPARKWSP